MRGVVVAVEQYEVSTFCAKKCFFSKVQIHKNHNSLKKYHNRSGLSVNECEIFLQVMCIRRDITGIPIAEPFMRKHQWKFKNNQSIQLDSTSNHFPIYLPPFLQLLHIRKLARNMLLLSVEIPNCQLSTKKMSPKFCQLRSLTANFQQKNATTA